MNNTIMKGVAAVSLLLIFSAIYFFDLGQSVVIDYDEGVYAEVSREMFKAQEYVSPTLNGEDFFEKPPLLYWMQMAGYHLYGVSSFGARFFNVIAGVITVLTLYLAASAPLGKKLAGRTSLILGSTFLFLYLSRVAMTDMLLTMFLTLCLTSSWYGVERAIKENGKGALFFWVGCIFAALAMLTKGVIGALFPLLTAIIYLLSIRKLSLLFRPSWLLPGIIIVTGLGFSWYIMLGVLHPDGFQFMQDLFVKHHFGRFSSAMEGHSGPLFYYLLVLLVGMTPWFSYILLTPRTALVYKSELASNRFIRLFAIHSFIVLVFFSLAATKLPNYILPAVPGLALLIAPLFDRIDVQYSKLWTLAGWFSGLLSMLIGVVFLVLPLVVPLLPDLLGENALKVPVLAQPIELEWMPWLGGILFLVSGAFVLRATQRKKPALVFKSLLVNALCLNCVMVLLVLPAYDRLVNRPVVELAVQAASITPEDKPILLYKVSERPSVNFYTDRNTIYKSERDHLELGPLFEEQQVMAGISTEYYLDRLKDYGVQVREIARDGGYVLFDIVGE